MHNKRVKMGNKNIDIIDYIRLLDGYIYFLGGGIINVVSKNECLIIDLKYVEKIIINGINDKSDFCHIKIDENIYLLIEKCNCVDNNQFLFLKKEIINVFEKLKLEKAGINKNYFSKYFNIIRYFKNG